MIFARKGLAYADKLLMVLGLSWMLMFVALRFIVGPSNRAPDERLARKGVRVVTNYVIKNLYQQMFFFLVPLYASSATWSLSSWNWWLVPLLLICAVVSTLDLVFDNFIMERRGLASLMYGLALFGVLNLMLPLVLGLRHFPSLLMAAGATAPAVALLTFRARSVATIRGLALVSVATGGLIAAAWYGRAFVPPVPMSLSDGAVGHGSESSYECLPGRKLRLRADQLDGLRCGSSVTEPGGVRDGVIHVWRHGGRPVARLVPQLVPGCADERVFRSYFPQEDLPKDPTGRWSCHVETRDGQLVGIMGFRVVANPAAAATTSTDKPLLDARIPDDAVDVHHKRDARADATPRRDASLASDARFGGDAAVLRDAGVAAD